MKRDTITIEGKHRQPEPVNPFLNTNYKSVRFADLQIGDTITRMEPRLNVRGEVIDRSFMSECYTVMGKTATHLSLKHPKTWLFATPFVIDLATHDDGKWSITEPIEDNIVCAGMFPRAFAIDAKLRQGWHIEESLQSEHVYSIYVPKSNLVKLNDIYMTWIAANPDQ